MRAGAVEIYSTDVNIDRQVTATVSYPSLSAVAAGRGLRRDRARGDGHGTAMAPTTTYVYMMNVVERRRRLYLVEANFDSTVRGEQELAMNSLPGLRLDYTISNIRAEMRRSHAPQRLGLSKPVRGLLSS